MDTPPQIAILNIQHPKIRSAFGASDHLICHEFFGGHDNLQTLLIKGKGLEAREPEEPSAKKNPTFWDPQIGELIQQK